MARMTLSRRGHLLLAALFWTLVGAFLAINGARLWFDALPAGQATWLGWALALTAVAAGLAKGKLVLDRSAAHVIERAPRVPASRPLPSLYRMFGPRMLLLIVAMVALGVFLRLAPVHPALRGWVLLAIGIALLWSSRRYWNAARDAAGAEAAPSAVTEEESA